MTPPRVRVIGGGVAGLTAALRLAERGYPVTVYEQSDRWGGALGSREPKGGIRFDVYPHMYLSWYQNFWKLLDDTSNVSREQLFTPYDKVEQLRAGNFPRYTSLTDPYKFSNVPKNLRSGVGRPADLYVFGYTNVDLVSEALNPSLLLDNLSLNGFLRSRRYMTERAAAAFDNWVTTVWGVASYLVSAEDYRKYVVYSFADHDPPLLLLNGSAHELVIQPLYDRLTTLDVDLQSGTRVDNIKCDGRQVVSITTQRVRFDPAAGQYLPVENEEPKTEQVDELVVAVAAGALGKLARAGTKGERIIDAEPDIAEVKRLRTQVVPILNVCFKRRLRGIPPEPVGLFESRFGLSFTDISQTWTELKEQQQTVLAVSSSYPYGLPGPEAEDNGFAMLRELARFIPFDPGGGWESPDADVDWERTSYQGNDEFQMFINDAGSDMWRPNARSTGLSNLCYAGDVCNNHIGMTTIEAAVVTGQNAASAVVQRHGHGNPVDVLYPREPSTELFSILRTLWAPYVHAAKTWSSLEDMVAGIRPLSTRLQSLVREMVNTH